MEVNTYIRELGPLNPLDSVSLEIQGFHVKNLDYVIKIDLRAKLYNRGGQTFLLTGQIYEKNCIAGPQKVMFLV